MDSCRDAIASSAGVGCTGALQETADWQSITEAITQRDEMCMRKITHGTVKL
jgi:hypothetical protein